jgi:hypothetical protein
MKGSIGPAGLARGMISPAAYERGLPGRRTCLPCFSMRRNCRKATDEVIRTERRVSSAWSWIDRRVSRNGSYDRGDGRVTSTIAAGAAGPPSSLSHFDGGGEASRHQAASESTQSFCDDPGIALRLWKRGRFAVSPVCSPVAWSVSAQRPVVRGASLVGELFGMAADDRASQPCDQAPCRPQRSHDRGTPGLG